MIPPPPTSTLFPYTTLFRSARRPHRRQRQPRSRHRLGHRLRVRRPVGRAARAADTARSVPAHASQDRKSTRLNSSHAEISYAVFCLKKKKRKSTKLLTKSPQ